MNATYLDLLVHPINKTSLQYDAPSNQLIDAITHDTFPVKDNVPVLLTTAIEASLMETNLHTSAGSHFLYKEHYQIDAIHYDYFKEVENPVEKEEINRLHQNILSQIPATAQWILDVGCGGGWLAKAMRDKPGNIISMDISEINPVKAIKNIPSVNHFGLVADVYELPVKEGTIDCIIASEIIEHVSDPKRFLGALYKVLKPGGKIIVTTPYNEKIQASLCIHCNHLTPHNAHLHSFTEESIKRYLPAGNMRSRTNIFNNKVLVKLQIQRTLKFLPLFAMQLIDKAANAITGKRAYRLMLIIEKDK